MKIGISGVGSLGLVIGGILTDNGYDVTLIDSPAGNNMDIINNKGVQIIGYNDKSIPCKCVMPWDIKDPFDIIFSITKQLQLKDSLISLKECIGENTTIVTCQNGIPEDEAMKIVPEEKVIGCSIAWGATRLSSGITKITTPSEKMDMVIGEIDGDVSSRAREIATILKCIGKIEISCNILGIKWTKLIMNSNFMGLCGMLGCTLGEVLLNKSLVKYVPYIALEGARVYNALELPLATLQNFTPDIGLLQFDNENERQAIIENIIFPVWMKLKNVKPSLVQDLEKGKKTEIQYINGKILEEGKRLNIETPVNEFLVNIIKDIENGVLKPSMENKYLLEKLSIE